MYPPQHRLHLWPRHQDMHFRKRLLVALGLQRLIFASFEFEDIINSCRKKAEAQQPVKRIEEGDGFVDEVSRLPVAVLEKLSAHSSPHFNSAVI